jgi:hypothetical protein
MAHANIIHDPENLGCWIINAANWNHNHTREIPLSGNACRKPTHEVKTIISDLATASNFSHNDIKKILKLCPEFDIKHPLEP